jgi:hypothetical protein
MLDLKASRRNLLMIIIPAPLFDWKTATGWSIKLATYE